MILPLFATLASSTIFIGGMAEFSAPACATTVNSGIVNQLDAESTLPDVVSYLRGAAIAFDLFSNREQRIQESQLDSSIYENLQPIKLIVAAPSKQRTELVKETELLVIIFDGRKRISSASCEIFYTGP